MVKSKMLFVLLGNNDTGKTSLQKFLASKICDKDYDKMPCDIVRDIIHPEINEKYKKIFFSNRSLQEKDNRENYKNMDTYFRLIFDKTKDIDSVDIAFISSHIDANSIADIQSLIDNAKKRFFNVIGVFFSNSIEQEKSDNGHIAKFCWDEKLILENQIITKKLTKKKKNQLAKEQIEKIAEDFVLFIVNRTNIS